MRDPMLSSPAVERRWILVLAIVASGACKSSSSSSDITPSASVTQQPSAAASAGTSSPTGSANAPPAAQRAAAAMDGGRATSQHASAEGGTPVRGDLLGCESSGVHGWSGDVGSVYAAAGLKRAGSKVTNDCGREVTPKIGAVSLGEPVGEAVVLTTEDCACYGNAGAQLVMLASSNGKWVPILKTPACGLLV